MKHSLASLAICITTWGCASAPAIADTPQSGTLELTLTQSTVTVGEPLILKYRVSNPENQRIHVAIDNDVSKWLTIRLDDASGHPVKGTQTVSKATPVSRNLAADGVPVGPKGYHEGFLILSPSYQPTQPGRYQLDLSAHLVSTWGWHDMVSNTSENAEAQQDYSLPLTVTARDPERLGTIAERLRQTVLGTRNIDQYRLANKALFSMHDPACLPVWQALATDANLDPWKAVDVMEQLQEVGSVSACDILAAMQPIAPERWSRTGTAPFEVLQRIWRPATPEVKRHINQLLKEAGAPEITEHTRPVGTMH